MKITVFTLFPAWFDGPLGDSILQRARDAGHLTIDIVNFRQWATDRHHSVDDTPYGGGGGMVLRADVLAEAMDANIGPPATPSRPRVLLMSPRGRVFDQPMAIELSRLPSIALVCGHYEGIDQRLIDSRIDEEVSLGDFVLTGGEIPAMAIIDAVARMIPGVLGNETSAPQDSFMNGLLEAPHYTRPEDFEGTRVPDVLLSGNHAAIAEWRESEALRLTRQRRPDLHAAQILSPAQVRRLARRARPLALWRIRPQFTILYASSLVHALGNLEELLGTTRYEVSETDPSIRFAEIRDAGSSDPDADRAHLLTELREMMSRNDAPGTSLGEVAVLLRNLLHEMEKTQ